MKKNSRGFIVIAAIALAMAVLGCGNKKAAVPAETTAPQTTAEAVQTTAGAQSEQKQEIKVTVILDGSAAGDKAINIRGEVELAEGATAYDALAAFCAAQKIEITGEPSFVTSIGGLGEDAVPGKSCGWLYSCNGEMAMEAADVCKIEDGDEITWELSVW